MTRITELMEKDVISLEDGQCLGRVCDAEIDTCDQKVCALVIFGRLKFFGLFGRREEFYIPWDCIQRIGDDIILVDKSFPRRESEPDRRRKRRF